MIWFNGALANDVDAIIRADNRGLLLGDGLFETVKIVDRYPVFLAAHLCRLKASCLEIDLPIAPEDIREGVEALLAQQDPAYFGSIRISIFRGSGPRGLAPIPVADQSPDVLITVAGGSGNALLPPARLVVAPFARSQDAPSTRMKTLSYTDNLRARAFAAESGADDAMFVTAAGNIASTTMANLVACIDGEFVTPPLSEGMLPGITRAKLLEEAALREFPLREGRVSLDEVTGRWLFRTNSLLGVGPAFVVSTSMSEQPKTEFPTMLMDLYASAEHRDRKE